MLKIKKFIETFICKIEDGFCRVFKYEERVIKRTIESYDRDLKVLNERRMQNMNQKHVRGIKGPCILNEHTFFHPIIHTNIDSMHTAFLGVVKTLFEYWFEGPNSKYSLKSKMEEINRNLLNIKPPSFVPASPRSIFDWRNWRSHEFMYFILFYSLIVFFNIMPVRLYEHLKALVISFEFLFSKNITREELIDVDFLLHKFVKNLPVIYDESILKSGFHELIHFSDSTKDFGPLNITSSYQFEEINRKISRSIKGQHLVGDEFLKIFLISQSLAHFTSLYSHKRENELFDFICTNAIIKTSNRKSIKNNSVRYSNIKFIRDKLLSKLILDYDNNQLCELKITEKIFFSNVCYSVQKKHGDFSDCFIKIKDKLGIIKYIILDENKVYFICQSFSNSSRPFSDKEKPFFKSKIFIADFQDELFVTKDIKHIQKLFYTYRSDTSIYFSILKTNHLFN